MLDSTKTPSSADGKITEGALQHKMAIIKPPHAGQRA